MSGSFRRSRPLQRDPKVLRDTRLRIVACDDTYAPQQYFGFFQFRGVQVHVVPTPLDNTTSYASFVLDRLLVFEHADDDERWMLLDTDHCINDNNFPSFVKILQSARQQGIRVCLSKPCFEFWLLLHHREAAEIEHLATAKEVEKELSTIPGGYNKAKLRREHYPTGKVRVACERARRLDENVKGGDRPEANTSRVYQLWESIIAEVLPLDRPEPLRDLVP
jgi:hypothetical protein